MRALVYENRFPRLAATRLLSALSPRAFVGPLAPIRLRELFGADLRSGALALRAPREFGGLAPTE